MYMICKYTSYNKYNKKCMTMSIEQGNKFSVKVVFSLNLSHFIIIQGATHSFY